MLRCRPNLVRAKRSIAYACCRFASVTITRHMHSLLHSHWAQFHSIIEIFLAGPNLLGGKTRAPTIDSFLADVGWSRFSFWP